MWEEKVEYHSQRIGDWVNKASKVDYQVAWRDADAFIDSSVFLDKSKDINVPTDLKSTRYEHERIMLGPYQIESNLVSNVPTRVQYSDMFKNTPFVPKDDPHGVWSFDDKTNLVRRQRVPGRDQVGDIRIGWIVQQKIEGKAMTFIGKQEVDEDGVAKLAPLANQLGRHVFDGTGHKKINLIRDHFKYTPLYNN